jgi:hypothetical protein
MKVGERKNVPLYKMAKKQMPGPVTRSLLGLEAGILGKFKLSAFAQNNCAHYEFRIDISECQTFNLIRIIHNVNPSRATTLGFGSINEAIKKIHEHFNWMSKVLGPILSVVNTLFIESFKSLFKFLHNQYYT